MKIRSLLALGLSFSIATAAFAADPKPGEKVKKGEETYLTPEEAPVDFKLQGEYGEAEAGKAKFGLQVIALSDNKYRAVIFPGGLPGAGWSGDKSTKEELDGTADGEKINIVAKGWTSITIDGQTATLKKGGSDDVVLKKVIRQSPTLGAKPAEGAKVLYGGPEDVSKWNNGHVDARGLLGSGATTKDKFKNYTIHVEFLLPFKPGGRGQGRANSGVYMQNRYEVQVLDSFGLTGANNECGGIYSQIAPSVNMCLPPLQWQTYDIDFEMAKDVQPDPTPKDPKHVKKAKNAVITVRHNGVVIHDKVEISGPTGGGDRESNDGGPIQLQGHGNPVFYRNVWIVEK